MTKQIRNLIISSIKRNDNQAAVAKTRATEIDVESLPQTTIDSLTSIFLGGGMKAGSFLDEPTPSKFARVASRAFTLNSDRVPVFSNFRETAATLAELLARTLNEAQAQNAKDGFLISYVYTHDFGDDTTPDIQSYLCNVFLHRIDGVDITTDLTFEEIERINLEKLSIGSKVCLETLMDSMDERPITFKISGRSEVSKFYQKFLGCTVPEEAIEDTKRLRDAIETFGQNNGYDKDGIESLCGRAQAFCKQRLSEADGYVNLRDLAGAIFSNATHAEAFVEYTHEDYRLSDTFVVNSSEVNKFTKLYIKTKEFTLQFKTSALTRNVDWNPRDKTLTFSNLPEHAVEQILNYLPSSSENETSN
ncbi:nucleoid-associated protein [Vibrio campbellii]|uniref:nucleoid-associated protein n=1 Tax=Vibrio campbellii TaxID=680 RepID=UPI0013154612|nr:nucleoid-associated protein [Vibrio campbellii]